MLVDRNNRLVQVAPGKTAKHEEPTILTKELSSTDSMLATIADPQRAPEMLAVRESIRGWRFYEGFRTDAASPVRVPQVGTFTPVLNNEGTDLAAALETIRRFGDRGRWTARWKMHSRAAMLRSMSRPDYSKSSFGSMGCCGRFRHRSYQMARCDTCSGRQLC